VWNEAEHIAAINACGVDEMDIMVARYQTYLEQLLSGMNVMWVAAYKRPFGRKLWYVELMNDWKVMDLITPISMDTTFEDEYKSYFKEALDNNSIDPQTAYGVEQAGKTRVARIGDAIAWDEWQSHWMYQRLQSVGVGERMLGTFTLDETAESYFTIDRAIGQPAFTQADADRFYHAIKLFPRLHYWLFLERGLVTPARTPLSPRQREVLRLLLKPLSEQEIAEQLSLTKGTTHNYVIELYKVFQVSSRYELMQLWLKRVDGVC